MFKSKHSGWTWELKRTPFGGGSWNPINVISDLGGSISDAVSGVGDALASIDPGPAIGQGLAQVDNAVNQVPGGWYTVGALGAGGTALAFAPEIAAAAGVDAGTTIGSQAGQDAFFNALANGASSAEAINTGLAADAAATASAAAELAGPTYQELGVTGVPEGGMGPTYAELGYTGLNNQEAIAAADAASKSQLLQNSLGNIKDASKIAQLLKQGAGSGLSSSLGKLAQGTNPAPLGLVTAVRGNQNPFTYTQNLPIQNKKPDLSSLAELLKQG